MTDEQHETFKMRIINNIWKSFFTDLNKTWNARYDEMGITGHIYKHANDHTGVLDVLDIGCSTGIATKTAQKCLNEHGIHIKTTGIDNSPKIKSNAIKNLDHFVQIDVFSSKADEYVGSADVVICANVANYLYKLFSRRDTARIIKRCSEFIKKDGILVTDAPDAKSIHDIFELDWKCTSMHPKSGFNLSYKLEYYKSNVYKKV